MMNDHDILHRRQVIYWRMLAALFGHTEQAPNMEQMAGEVAQELGLPPILLDPRVGVDTMLQRYPADAGAGRLQAAAQRVWAEYAGHADYQNNRVAGLKGLGMPAQGFSPSVLWRLYPFYFSKFINTLRNTVQHVLTCLRSQTTIHL
jgi:hypothetical protein